MPRFLAIQEAYEVLATTRGRTVRGGGRPPAPQPAAEPWRADPDRARRAREAAREAARARAERTRRMSGDQAAGSAAGAGLGSTPGAGAGAGKGAGKGTGAGGRRPGSRSRQTRKATLGSTSYDEARDPLDSAWGGAAWYGPTSGEYWTVNPREYADPRKHGPEYQARGRRLNTTPTARAGDEVRVDSAGDAQAAPAEDPAAADGGARRGRAAAGPTGQSDAWSFDPEAATGSGWSDAGNPDWPRHAATPRSTGETPRPAGVPDRSARRWSTVQPAEGAVPGDRAPAQAVASGASTARDPLGRLGLALVAWPPLAIAIATLVGSLTGCAEFSASCTGAAPLLPWLGQVLLLGVLLLAPPVSRVLAMGTLGVLVALVPITAFLVAFGGGFDPHGGPVLGTLLAVAWVVGVGYGLVSRARPSGLS